MPSPYDDPGPHEMVIMPRTGISATHTGRTLHRVACLTCEIVIHPATTAPHVQVRRHFEGDKGYDIALDEIEAFDEGHGT